MLRFLEILRDFGLEYFKRYYGWYPGRVVNVTDPEGQGRVKVRVPMLLLDPGRDTLPNWAYPMFGPFTPGDDKGSYNVPRVGDKVWVAFRNGNSSVPMYSPWGWFGTGERPAEFETVEDRGWKTHGGHLVLFRDLDGAKSIVIRHDGGGEIEFDPFDAVTLKTSAGDLVKLDPAGNILVQHNAGTKVELSSTDVTVESAAQVTVKSPRILLDGTSNEIGSGAVHPLAKGDILTTWFVTLLTWALGHTHPIAPGAPASGPAVPPLPPPPSFISTKSKTG